MYIILSVTQGRGSGAEAILEELLRAWPLEGPALTLLAPPGSRPYLAAREHRIPCVGLETSRDTLPLNLKGLRRCRPDLPPFSLVHAWTARALDGALWLGRQRNRPVTGTLHDDPRASFHGFLRQRLMRFCANRLTELVCVSDAVARACAAQRYTCPLEVIRNGVADRPLAKEASDTVRIGFAGMQAALKGFAVVAEWIEHTADQPVAWRLYGRIDAPNSAPLRAVLDRHGSRVQAPGNVPPEQIFSEVDILVHPSMEFDSLPTALIEAAQAGIPAVASDRGGAREILVDDGTGFLFDPDAPEVGLERLLDLIKSADARRSLGRSARARYEDFFRSDRMVRAYRELWERASGQDGNG